MRLRNALWMVVVLSGTALAGVADPSPQPDAVPVVKSKKVKAPPKPQVGNLVEPGEPDRGNYEKSHRSGGIARRQQP